MELPNAPFYRRWSVLLAGVIGLAAIVALLGWRGLQQVPTTATTTTAPPTTIAPPSTTTPPTSFGPTSKPDDVLWSAMGPDVQRSDGFQAPAKWRIEWEYDCSNFDKLGAFKITGSGAFERVDIQTNDLKASGRSTYNRGGYGRLLVESVCDEWKVTVLSG